MQVFGRRQTFWDMVFGLLTARDKSLPVILLELVATVMINFTAGLSVSVFAFLFQARGVPVSDQGWVTLYSMM